MREIDLTFGIPLYNGEQYIKELLECFKYSDKIDYEILVVDDGSTDNGCDICTKYKNVRVIKQKNMGVSKTRNVIIENAKGRWITFIDADDIIDFEKYMLIFEKVKKRNYDLAINVYNEQNYKRVMKSKHRLTYLIESEIINSPCTKFYKKIFLNENEIRFKTEINLGEDKLYNIEYFKNCNEDSIMYFYSSMYNYRQINNFSLTNKYRKDKFETVMSVYEKCKDLLEDKEELKAIEYIRIKKSISCLKSMYKMKLNYREKVKYISMMKNYKARNLFFLNNMWDTSLYNLWYFVPSFIMALIF